MGIVAMIIAFKKGRKGYGIFLAIWEALAIIMLISTKGAYALVPGWLFLIIAICMHKNYDYNATNDNQWKQCSRCGEYYSKNLHDCPYCSTVKKNETQSTPKKIEVSECKAVPADPVSEGFVRCASCGKVQKADRTVCLGCGAIFIIEKTVAAGADKQLNQADDRHGLDENEVAETSDQPMNLLPCKETISENDGESNRLSSPEEPPFKKRLDNTKPVAEQLPKLQILFCRKCGQKLDDESMFCKRCGAKVR